MLASQHVGPAIASMPRARVGIVDATEVRGDGGEEIGGLEGSAASTPQSTRVFAIDASTYRGGVISSVVRDDADEELEGPTLAELKQVGEALGLALEAGVRGGVRCASSSCLGSIPT